VELYIADVLGQVVYKNAVKAQKGMLNYTVHSGDNLTNGIYLLTLSCGGEKRIFHITVRP
jgi:hypothetical protein